MSLSVVAPDLFEPWPENQRELPRYPALELLLSRGRRQPAAEDTDSTLAGLLGFSDGTFPAAALAWLGDFNSLPGAVVLYADPVFLRADGDRLLLFPLSGITGDEAGALQHTFNEHFAADGLQLEISAAGRWYLLLRKDHSEPLPVQPLSAVAGRYIHDFMPESALWRAWLNETQMLFFQHPVNAQRQARGEYPVSGLWFSGGGHIEEIKRRPGLIKGNEAFLQGLRQLEVPVDKEKELHYFGLNQKAVIQGDSAARLRALHELDHCLQGIMRDQSFDFYACQGEKWRWRPTMKHRYWKRIRRIDWNKLSSVA